MKINYYITILFIILLQSNYRCTTKQSSSSKYELLKETYPDIFYNKHIQWTPEDKTESIFIVQDSTKKGDEKYFAKIDQTNIQQYTNSILFYTAEEFTHYSYNGGVHKMIISHDTVSNEINYLPTPNYASNRSFFDFLKEIPLQSKSDKELLSAGLSDMLFDNLRWTGVVNCKNEITILPKSLHWNEDSLIVQLNYIEECYSIKTMESKKHDKQQRKTPITFLFSEDIISEIVFPINF